VPYKDALLGSQRENTIDGVTKEVETENRVLYAAVLMTIGAWEKCTTNQRHKTSQQREVLLMEYILGENLATTPDPPHLVAPILT
jgi:hypothetical protein